MAVYRITSSTPRKSGRRLVREGKAMKRVRGSLRYPAERLLPAKSTLPIRGIAGAVFRAVFDFNRRKL